MLYAVKKVGGSRVRRRTQRFVLTATQSSKLSRMTKNSNTIALIEIRAILYDKIGDNHFL